MTDSFLTRIKRAMRNPDNTRGRGGNVVVLLKDLHELIHHFERLDNESRNQHAAFSDKYGHLVEVARIAAMQGADIHEVAMGVVHRKMSNGNFAEGVSDGIALVQSLKKSRMAPSGETVQNSTFAPVQIEGELLPEFCHNDTKAKG